MRSVTWLLKVAPTAAKAAGVLESLVQLPSVPLGWAVDLVSAGVRISYAQLLDAVNSMVKGVEVWVQAQQQLGVGTDIPLAAVTICGAGSATASSHMVSSKHHSIAGCVRKSMKHT
jgi:hypothetical protein